MTTDKKMRPAAGHRPDAKGRTNLQPEYTTAAGRPQAPRIGVSAPRNDFGPAQRQEGGA